MACSSSMLQVDKHFVDGLCDAGPEGHHCLSKPVKVFQSKDELHNSIPTVGLLGAVQNECFILLYSAVVNMDFFSCLIYQYS